MALQTEAWVAIGTFATAALAAAKYLYDRRHASTADVGSSTLRIRQMDENRLTRLESEVLDPSGTMRSRFHSQANQINEAMLKAERATARLDAVEAAARRIEEKVDKVLTQLADVREDVAELRGRDHA